MHTREAVTYSRGARAVMVCTRGAVTYLREAGGVAVCNLKMASRTRLSLHLNCHWFKDHVLKFHSRGREPGDDAMLTQYIRTRPLLVVIMASLFILHGVPQGLSQSYLGGGYSNSIPKVERVYILG